jgi:hypothetical protein
MNQAITLLSAFLIFLLPVAALISSLMGRTDSAILMISIATFLRVCNLEKT